MKKSSRLLALALAGLLVGSASAQVFLGFDNFNDNTLTLQGANNQAAGQWGASNPGTGGAWTESSQRMNYTHTADSYGSLRWVSPAYSVNGAPSGQNLGIGGAGLSSGSPYTSSWSVQVSLTTTTTPTAGYTLGGLEIYTLPTSGPVDAYYGAYLMNEFGSGNRLLIERGLWNDTLSDYDRESTVLNIGDNTNVFVRAMFDGATKELSFFYSTTFPTFVSTGVTYDLDGAHAQPSAPLLDGMGMNLAAFSGGGAHTIGAGQMYFDNFSAIAIPEPSTYAALAGLGALGLAFWHRRRKVLAAT